MIFCATDFTVPYLNFAAEYYLATERDLHDDVFMLWRNEPSVIVGRFQNTYEEVNVDYCRSKGIHIARRMSGGGTVYHDLGCWEFTFICRDDNPEIEFARFMDPMAEMLSGLGIDVRVSGRNDICLVAKNPDGEKTYKISGNTQYKKNGVTVHHGTLLFDTDIGELVRSTTPKDYKIVSKAIRSVRERVTNIRSHLARDMTSEEFGEYIASHFSESIYRFDNDDLARIRELEPMFSDDRWVFGENPKFELKRLVSCPSGNAEIGLTVRRGTIVSAGISGDFFSADSNGPDSAFGQRLAGVPFSPETVRAALAGFDNEITGISPEMIVEGIFMTDDQKLSDLRKEIDAIDSDIIGLLSKRMELSARIGKHKKEHGIPVSDPEREYAVIKKLENISGKELRPYVEEIYRSVIDASKKIQSETLPDDPEPVSD